MKRIVLYTIAVVVLLGAAAVLFLGSNFQSTPELSGSVEHAAKIGAPTSGGNELIVELNESSLPRQPAIPQSMADHFESQLKAASLAFNVPERMMLNQTTTIELAIAPATQDQQAASVLSSGLSGQVVIEGTEYSLQMEARLIGEDFDIPESRQRKLVLPNRPSKWVWQVTPRKVGEQKRITLEISALLSNPQNELSLLPVQTLQRVIVVDVTFWEKVIGGLQSLDTVQASIAGVIGLGSTVLAAIGWFRRRKSK